MIRHTTGPWAVIKSERGNWIEPKDGADPDSCIAECYPYGEPDQIYANERLIATAPETLDALKGCAALLKVKCKDDEVGQAYLDKVTAIINKAEGKKP